MRHSVYDGKLKQYERRQETLQLFVPEEHQNAIGNKASHRYKFTQILEDDVTQEVGRSKFCVKTLIESSFVVSPRKIMPGTESNLYNTT